MIFTLLSAWAQEAADLPIDVERFRPVLDTMGFVNTESSTTLGHLQVGIGLWGNYSDDQVVLLRNGRRVIGPGPKSPDGVINERSLVHLQAGFGVGNRFSLSASMPLFLWQEGFEPIGSGYGTNELVSSGIGDLQVSPKLVLVDIQDNVPVGVAIIANVNLPTGSKRSFLGEGTVTATPLLAVEFADGAIRDRDYHVRFALNAGARIKEADTFRGLKLGTTFEYRGAFAVHPVPALELAVEVTGAVGGALEPQIPVEILPHIRLLPLDMASLVAGVGFGLTEGVGSPDFRGFVGATLSPKFDPMSLDRDKDGIPNKYDKCISIPEDRDGFEDEDGCPEDDNDGDGYIDSEDGCPNDPEDFDNFQDADGCPDLDNDADRIPDVNDRCPLQPEDYDGFQDLDGCPEPDNDLDGFLDPVDRCPNAAETLNGFEDLDGCPDEKPFYDTDGDGLTDDLDQCPFDPEDFDGFEDEDGCPELDNDLDGIVDTRDQCPFDPETRNGYLDEDGCPDTAPSRVVLERTKITILEKVFFEVNKATIRDVSFGLLDEVAAVMIDHPALTLVRVEGHTDSDGSEAYNNRLSQSRAESVVTYLINRGVESARLDAVGFGEARPIDTNATKEGKQNNRRVEFVIVEQD